MYSEDLLKRRNELVEWIKKELIAVPVSVYGEENRVSINYGETLICGVSIEQAGYRIFGVNADWAEITTYHCEMTENGSFTYYLESEDECIAECSRLVIFEAKKGAKKIDQDSKSPIERIGEQLELLKKEYPGFQCERKTRRKREPEYFKLFYGNSWIGELWATPEGPHLWTNEVSKKENYEILAKGRTKRKPYVLYLKESSVEKGFHYTEWLPDYNRIPEVVGHLIRVCRKEE